MEKQSVEHIEELKQALRSYLERVTAQNFSGSYDGAISLLEAFRGKISKSDAIKALHELDHEWKMNDWQEEVFLEVSCRLEGFASYTNVIDWY